MKKHILCITTIIAGTFIATPVFATTMDTNVNIRPSMTLSVSTNNINLNLNPATKPFDTKDLTITIGTNNPTGYKLYLTSDSTNLVNTKDSSKTIETLPSSTPASGYDQASFPANYWGYRKSNGSSSSGNYLPFNSDLLVSSSTGPSNETTTSIGLASKIDYLKESGTYTLNFKLNAVPTITQYYMQDLKDPTLASSVCVAEHPTIVFDSRDEQAYMIQRLPDGRCWMLDNLNLDLTSRSVAANLTPTNTNADSASLNALINGGGNDSNGLATSGLTLSNWDSGTDSFTMPLVNTAGTCSTTQNVPCEYDGTYTHNTILSTLVPNSTFGLGSGKIGVYYNYCATTAGSYCYSNNHAGTHDAQYDICPANWRLPTGGPNGEFQILCSAIYGSNCKESVSMDAASSTSLQYKLSTPLSGLYFTSSGVGAAHRQGLYSTYRTSTQYNNTNPYVFRTWVSRISVTNTGDVGNDRRTNAASIRCILKES